MSVENNIGWFAHPQFIERAALFEKRYHMSDFLISGDPKFKSKKVNGRYGDYCLFCGKSYPEVSFDNAPHMLSRMMGSDLYSNFECDICNSYFSKFETDAASYLGISRSIIRLSDERKAPGFPGRGIEVKTFTFKGKKVSVIHKEDAERNIETGTTTLKYGKPSYTPSNVYKLFVKCGLSLLPTDEVKSKYSETLSFLRNDKMLGGSHICIYRYPFSVKMPLHTYIFSKKNTEDKVPSHVVSFYFDNNIITLPVPLHYDDLKFYNQAIDMPIAPPYFVDGNDMVDLKATTSIEDLSSSIKVKNDEEELTMRFNEADLNNTVMFNPLTGEETQASYNPVGSRYMIATTHGVSFTKEELKELAALIDAKFVNNST